CCLSSRRRHTRSKRDWSSDVCSSDLSLGRELDALDDLLRGDVVGGEGVEGDEARNHLGHRRSLLETAPVLALAPEDAREGGRRQPTLRREDGTEDGGREVPVADDPVDTPVEGVELL